MKLFHIIKRAEWEKAQTEGTYHPASLDNEGFIHASKKSQVLSTANRRYKGGDELLILIIDSHKVKPEIRYEYSTGAKEEHPHLYGELNLDAVEQALEFKPNKNGEFTTFPKAE